MTLRTRLTEKLGIAHPVLLAPMGSIAGGKLAGSVSEAGGLGLIGGGYGEESWLEREFVMAEGAPRCRWWRPSWLSSPGARPRR
jgi:nitronate monooxygenase